MVGEESEKAAADRKSHGPLTQLQESAEDTKKRTKAEQVIKKRRHYRLRVRIIYIIDRRCGPFLITAGILE